MVGRGLFIVFEGLDRSGKSSQAGLLVEHLRSLGRTVKALRFPARDSGPIGKMIDEYLRSGSSLSDETVHLLFSANRWELASSIKADLASGIDIVCDRYLYSGVVYSASKGLPWDWCAAPDRLLPRPDVVLFLNVDPEVASQRGAYGAERYEQVEFQSKVRENFRNFQVSEASYWRTIDANGPYDGVTEKIKETVRDLLENSENGKIENLAQIWPENTPKIA